jgi:hypothetical protein
MQTVDPGPYEVKEPDKKAKEWGIPVISVEKFITYCTFG